ncbi:MAG TPA: HAD-IA family hydrolase [Vicinamibacteria bacterium]|nr:HAD-IA family hydrolase [Vicinamibacteria bacterium]
MRPKRFDTFLFDLDGTLLDSVDLILSAFRHTAIAHLGRALPDDVWLRGLGTPLRRQLGDVTDDPDLIEAMVVTYREYHVAHHDRSVRLYPGVVEVLAALEKRGVKLGVVTSKLRFGAERGLSLTGLAGYFQALVTADEVENHKPHPEPVLTAITRLDTAPERAIFVGDSPHDVASGRAAHVATAAVLWGPFAREVLVDVGPDFLVRAPAELLGI